MRGVGVFCFVVGWVLVLFFFFFYVLLVVSGVSGVVEAG